MTYVRPHIYINKLISPIFNCVTPVSVSLATLAKYIYILTHMHTYTLKFCGEYAILMNLKTVCVGIVDSSQ